ncbi:MAG: Crp/Fnr family transcriptional regulator [Pseudomonadota bacterium]
MNKNPEQGFAQSLIEEPEMCANCSIRHSSLCSALNSEEIMDLNAIASRKRLDAGQTFLFEGDSARSFANVTDGVAKLVRGAEDGRSQIVGLLFPSDFLGGSLGSGAVNKTPHAIEAVSQIELCIFPRPKFEDLLHKYPSLEFKLLNRTMSELQIAREWMVLLGRKTAEERVATFLLHVAEKMKNVTCKGQGSFDLPLNRADIADYIGLTLETVSRQISRLKKDGIIQIEGAKHITFIDEEALKRRANF